MKELDIFDYGFNEANTLYDMGPKGSIGNPYTLKEFLDYEGCFPGGHVDPLGYIEAETILYAHHYGDYGYGYTRQWGYMFDGNYNFYSWYIDYNDWEMYSINDQWTIQGMTFLNTYQPNSSSSMFQEYWECVNGECTIYSSGSLVTQILQKIAACPEEVLKVGNAIGKLSLIGGDISVIILLKNGDVTESEIYSAVSAALGTTAFLITRIPCPQACLIGLGLDALSVSIGLYSLTR